MASEDLMAYMAGQDGATTGGGGMFGGSDGWWGIILLALLFGWGGNRGFGGGGGSGGGDYGYKGAVSEGFALNGIENGIRGIQQGLCDGFYAQNTSLLQGFNGVERGFATLSTQLGECCCENRAAIAQVRYDMATQACDTRRAICDAARDITENANANTRTIMDFMVNSKIEALQAENQALKFQASQSAQNAFIVANQEAQTAELIRRINPTPVPAYTVPAPYPYAYQAGCGCGC